MLDSWTTSQRTTSKEFEGIRETCIWNFINQWVTQPFLVFFFILSLLEVRTWTTARVEVGGNVEFHKDCSTSEDLVPDPSLIVSLSNQPILTGFNVTKMSLNLIWVKLLHLWPLIGFLSLGAVVLLVPLWSSVLLRICATTEPVLYHKDGEHLM